MKVQVIIHDEESGGQKIVEFDVPNDTDRFCVLTIGGRPMATAWDANCNPIATYHQNEWKPTIVLG